YLAAATAAGLAATLIVNKSDLGIDAALTAELAVYRAAGYDAVTCSAESGTGVGQLRALLTPGAVAALVGQSGVGKSSLVQCLVPQATYSSSPPTGTPWAMRVARMPRRAASSPRKWAVASPSTVELVARISSRTPPCARIASSSRTPSCSGPMPSSGDRCPMSTK